MSVFSLKNLLICATICAPALITGCTTASEPQMPPLKPGESSLSNYLVGQYAVRHRDMENAADFLSTVHESKDFPTELDDNLKRQLFAIYASEGRFEQAAKIAGEINNENLMAKLVLALEDVVAGDMAAARTKVDDIPGSGLGAYVKPLIQTWLIAATDGVDAALKAIAPMQKEKGLEALYHLHTGLLYDFKGDVGNAEKHYKLAAQGENGMSLRLAELYAALLVKQNRVNDAQAVYGQYFMAHPDSLYIQALLDELNSGMLAKTPAITIKDGLAEALFGLASSLRSHSTRQVGLIMGHMTLHVKPKFPIARILVAEILESDRRFADANRIYATIDKKNPFSWSARLRMALNLDDLGDQDGAITILEEMVAQHPDRLEVLVTLGDVLRHHEKFEKAEKIYGQAIGLIGQEVGAHHWNLFYSRAISLERLKRWDEAEPLFLKALELEPNQPFVLNYLGYSWIENGRHLERAQAMIEEAVAQRPRDGYIVDSLGWVLYRLGQYEKSVPHLERAVELQPSDPVINDHLGDAYWKVGRNREARFQWYRAKSLNPTPDVLETIEQKIANGLETE